MENIDFIALIGLTVVCCAVCIVVQACSYVGSRRVCGVVASAVVLAAAAVAIGWLLPGIVAT